MKHEFHIESVFKIRGEVYVFTHYLSRDNFVMSGSPTLGGIPIHNWSTQPRRLKLDGTPDGEAFIFVLKNKTDADRVPLGKDVELKISIMGPAG